MTAGPASFNTRCRHPARRSAPAARPPHPGWRSRLGKAARGRAWPLLALAGLALPAQAYTPSNDWAIGVVGSTKDEPGFGHLALALEHGNFKDLVAPVTTGWFFPENNLGEPASVWGTVMPGGNTFYGYAGTPPSIDSPYDGAQAKVGVFRSFIKMGDDASMSFTYQKAVLKLKHPYAPAADKMCPIRKCLSAFLSSYASVTSQNSFWTETQTAELFVSNATVQKDLGKSGSIGMIDNPAWQWESDFAEEASTLTLLGPYTASLDLSLVPVGGMFTVSLIMTLEAVYDGAYGPFTADAIAFDPLNANPGTATVTDSSTGIGFAYSGLAPVPEPAPAALLALGLAALLLRNRRRGTR